MTQSRTALFSRKQAGGLFTIVNLEETPNDVFFVCSVTGSDATGYGYNPDSPVATIDYAVGLCTASKGDVIYVLPGHAENLASATACALDVAGIRVIGVGHGGIIPTLTATAAAGCVAITAESVVVKNIKVVAGFATGCTNGITVSADADYCELDHIVTRDTTTDKEWLIHISVATTVTDLTIKNCDIVGLAGGSCTNAILYAGTSSNVRIFDNIIDVDSSASAIEHSAGKPTSILAKDNTILNQDTDATDQYCIELKSDGTGLVVGNMGSYANAGAACYVGSAAFFVENYGGNTAGSSGELDPAAVAIP